MRNLTIDIWKIGAIHAQITSSLAALYKVSQVNMFNEPENVTFEVEFLGNEDDPEFYTLVFSGSVDFDEVTPAYKIRTHEDSPEPTDEIVENIREIIDTALPDE